MMKIQRQLFVAIFLAGAMTAGAFAQEAPAPKPAAPAAKPAAPAAPEKPAAAAADENPDKVVLKVGTQSYTKADMEFLIGSLSPQLKQAVALQGTKPLGDQYAVMSALSQQAEKDHLDATETFHEQMALHRLQALAQAEYEKIADEVKVTPEEISLYYTAHASDYDQAEVREVVIRKKPDGSKADVPGLTSAEAHARADDIRKALLAGTDPQKVADQYGAENTVMLDAKPRTINHGQLIAVLDKAAFELKDGQVSDPYENPQALAFLQVVGHKHQDLKDVSSDIESNLHELKLQAAVDGLKKKANVWMDEDYFKVPAEAHAPEATEPKQ
jgi:PPIC-type PPIASE domain